MSPKPQPETTVSDQQTSSFVRIYKALEDNDRTVLDCARCEIEQDNTWPSQAFNQGFVGGFEWMTQQPVLRVVIAQQINWFAKQAVEEAAMIDAPSTSTKPLGAQVLLELLQSLNSIDGFGVALERALEDPNIMGPAPGGHGFIAIEQILLNNRTQKVLSSARQAPRL